MPSFRRFHSGNVTGDVSLVKVWRDGGDSRDNGPDHGLAASTPGFEVRGLESEGMSGNA